VLSSREWHKRYVTAEAPVRFSARVRGASAAGAVRKPCAHVLLGYFHMKRPHYYFAATFRRLPAAFLSFIAIAFSFFICCHFFAAMIRLLRGA